MYIHVCIQYVCTYMHTLNGIYVYVYSTYCNGIYVRMYVYYTVCTLMGICIYVLVYNIYSTYSNREGDKGKGKRW